MKVAMLDPSLFTGRYDDSLCAALAQRGHDVRLLGRPMRATDAIVPHGYAYVPRFFGFGESVRALLGDGLVGKAVKACEYSLDAIAGPLGALDGDVVHAQWLPFAWADATLLGLLGIVEQKSHEGRRPAGKRGIRLETPEQAVDQIGEVGLGF